MIESEGHALEIAMAIAEIARRVGVPVVFKASFDKANRTSIGSFRGPGLEDGLRVLGKVKERTALPILTDIHDASQAAPAARVADILQIPAFLSRQTDLIVAAAKTGRAINIKKGQFLAPKDMKHAIAKVTDSGNTKVIVTERGVSFGYNNLVVDPRSFPMLRALGYPVVFDVTHSLQLPGAGDGVTAGLAEYIEPMAQAGVAAGVDGVFMEVHEEPSRAKSDAANALRLDRLEPLLRRLVALDKIVRECLTSRSPARSSRPRRPRCSRWWIASTIASRQRCRWWSRCKGRVIVTGMGKSGIICRKIAATLASTGTPAFFLHPAEAVHGDLGVIQSDDVVIAMSYSGETEELTRVLETLKRIGAPLIALTGGPNSTLAQAANVALDCSVSEEACPMNLVPTASTTAALAMGDALAMTVLVEKGFKPDDFASLHPGGKLGKRLMRVEQLMHSGDVAASRAASHRHARRDL